jgi:hypothetical protein
VGSLETIILRSFLGLIILLTSLDIRDVIDGVIICNDLTERCLLHMGSAVISLLFCPLVDLPLSLRAPRRGPRSFLQKLYILRDLCFYCLPVCYSSATAAASSSLCFLSPCSPRAFHPRMPIKKVADRATVTPRSPRGQACYPWQLSRTSRISPQINASLFYVLCPHSCAPGSTSRSITHP